MAKMTSEPRHAAAAGKKAKVKVTATPLNSAPWVEFAMDAEFPDGGGKQDSDKLKFDAGAGAFEMVFDLDDGTKLDLAFYDTPGEAMWVTVGVDKPTQPGFANGTITPVSISEKKLVVTNSNASAETMNFILRFRGNASPGGYPPYVLDPIIINGGERV